MLDSHVIGRVSLVGITLFAWPVAAQDADSLRAPEVVTVRSVTRAEQASHLAPAPVSVITDASIEMAPANQIGELLRKVEGLNVVQISARDYQVAGRSASGSLSTGQLVLVDGRTIYLDFFGFVMWDFLPIDPGEIKQIEVVRGPGSAVWGANALTGVINVITKSPRELVGPSSALDLGQYAQRTTVVGGGGGFETGYGSISHAGVRGKLSYKASGAFYRQDAYDRPTGNIPESSQEYPTYPNTGTQQPKFEARVDYDIDRWSKWSVSTGYAGTDGILHSGIGPFDIDRGTAMGYGRASYERQQLRVEFFANILDGDAMNLLTASDVDGSPIQMKFETQTYNIGVTNNTLLGQYNVLTYGANGRFNSFDLTIAPTGKDRNEVGAFIQDELLLLDERLRIVAGLRWDNFDPIGSVWSPRGSVLYSPFADHTFRFSFNRAFRAPSMVQNFLDITIVTDVPIAPGVAFPLESAAVGNPDLKEETLTAFELGWVGAVHERADVSFSVYHNELENNMDFFPAEFYTDSIRPPGWPDTEPVPPNRLPSKFTYRNVGEIVNRGFEIGLNARPAYGWTAFANYSWQDTPEPKGIDQVRLPNGELRDPINTPPQHRVNFGGAYDRRSFFASTDLSFVDHAFWTDVLDSRFWGPTSSYRQWNAKAGVRLMDERVVLSLIGTNLLDERIQQHVFGDIIAFRLLGEARLTY